MTISNASFRSWNSASRRVPDWLVQRSSMVQRRRRRPRFDWLENRRLLAPVVAVYPVRYEGGMTEGVAASSSEIWVTEQSGSLASINPTTGHSTQYNIPTPNSGPTAIAYGPDKNSMWFLETTANQIGEINLTTDAISEFPLLDTPNAGLSGITAGPGDEVWFTESNTNKIGMINTQTGAISEFSLPGVGYRAGRDHVRARRKSMGCGRGGQSDCVVQRDDARRSGSRDRGNEHSPRSKASRLVLTRISGSAKRRPMPSGCSI